MTFLAHYEQFYDKTFADAKALYLRDFKGKDIQRVELALSSVAPYIDHLRLIAIDNDALEQFKFDRFHGKGHFADHKPAMAGTTNKELTQVVTVLQQATKLRRWLPSAPQILHVDGPVKRGYPFNYEEQNRLAWAMPTSWDVDVLCFAANTGARKEELFGLKWTDERIYQEEGVTLFILRETKNGCVRALICNSIARKCVENQRRWQAKHGQNEYVFPKKMCPSSNGKTWITVWSKAGMPADPLWKRGIHNTRHAYATRLRAVEIADEDRNWLLGHNKTDISQLYALGNLITLSAKSELVTTPRKMLNLH